jgi:hypothetical protein
MLGDVSPSVVDNVGVLVGVVIGENGDNSAVVATSSSVSSRTFI